MSRTEKDKPEKFGGAPKRGGKTKSKLWVHCEYHHDCDYVTPHYVYKRGAINEHSEIHRATIEREALEDELAEGVDPLDLEDRSCLNGQEHCTDWPYGQCCYCGAYNGDAPYTSEGELSDQ